MSKPVSVVVVDDSATMRGLITAFLRREPDIEVVGTAADPYEARTIIKQTSPDVITLDIEMPKMDGISFLEKIMRLRPMPVIMLSTLTKEGADSTIQALALGAFDCIAKPTNGAVAEALKPLPDLIRAAAKSNVARMQERPAVAPRLSVDSSRTARKLIAIGSSTGGVEALGTILSQFPENCPPTVITQHMPENFTKSFANRLNGSCAPTIAEAEDGAPLLTGHIYIAPGGPRHLKVGGVGEKICQLVEGPTENGHRPSVDILFRSVAASCKGNSLGVILTGMGRDGAAGLLEMRNQGAATIGQDEATCVVYGMPKSAYEMGAVERQMPLARIATGIFETCRGETSVNAA
ncbi:MAG: protein-glutamate methylesterase/protein-glutamine glutaminase [Parvularcula sp.]